MSDTTLQTPPEGTQPVAPAVEIKSKEGEGIEPVTPATPEPKTPEGQVPPEQTPVVPPAAPKTPEAPDYRKKFGESTRRNQIVESQFSELQKILGDITRQEVPTDSEMEASIADWTYLSEREKNAERKLIVLERRQNHMMKTFSTIASETENVAKLEKFVEGEPRLKGKEDDFLIFVNKPANKGASMEVLLNAFLFEVKPPEATPPVTPPAGEIPPSLERGTSSGNMPPVSTGAPKYSDEEITAMRTHDHKKYNELVRKGII